MSTHNLHFYGEIRISTKYSSSITPVPTLVTQLDVRLTGGQEVAGWTLPGRQHSFVEIDNEIFSTVILCHLLIQEGQLSVSGKECAQYRLTTWRTKPAQ